MNSKIVALPKPPPPPNDEVVRACKALMELAEKGSLRALVYAGQVDLEDGPGTIAGQARSERCSTASLIVAMERSKLIALGVQFREDE